MAFLEAVVLIVAIVMLAKIVKDRQRRAEDALSAPDNQALHAEIARLKDRVEVLERIATDAPRRLSDEIERLRS